MSPQSASVVCEVSTKWAFFFVLLLVIVFVFVFVFYRKCSECSFKFGNSKKMAMSGKQRTHLDFVLHSSL